VELSTKVIKKVTQDLTSRPSFRVRQIRQILDLEIVPSQRIDIQKLIKCAEMLQTWKRQSQLIHEEVIRRALYNFFIFKYTFLNVQQFHHRLEVAHSMTIGNLLLNVQCILYLDSNTLHRHQVTFMLLFICLSFFIFFLLILLSLIHYLSTQSY